MPRPLRHLGHPALTLVFLAVLSIDTTLWHASVQRPHAALIIPPQLWSFNGVRINPRFSPRASITLDASGALDFRPISPMGKDGDYLPPSHTHLGELSADIFPSTSGLIAPVLTRAPHTLVVHPAHLQPSAVPTPAQLAEARARFADHVATYLVDSGDPDSPIPALLAAGDGTRTILNPTALLHDLIALPVALLTAASALATPRWLLRRYRRQRPSHLCPTCRYDRTGLPSSIPCPECGHAAPHQCAP